jgi:hypothetical protein
MSFPIHQPSYHSTLYNLTWCILYNQRDATYTTFFIIISALHVGTVQLKLNSSNPSTPAVESRKAWQYPRLHIQFYKLLMMGGGTVRNMYSADNNKEHCISCILLVIYNTLMEENRYLCNNLLGLLLVPPLKPQIHWCKVQTHNSTSHENNIKMDLR